MSFSSHFPGAKALIIADLHLAVKHLAVKRRSSTVGAGEQQVPFGFAQGRLSAPSLALRLRSE
jgi:hypothetical protein